MGVAPGLLFDAVAVRGGTKCEGAMERVVQEGSAAVTKGGPLRMEMDSEMDCDKRRSWEERKVAEEMCGGFVSDVEGVEVGSVG